MEGGLEGARALPHIAMKNKFPTGWNEDKVKRVINHYKNQSEDEVATEDEAAFAVEEVPLKVFVSQVKRFKL